MFEFLFKYPATVFSKGQFVLLSAWPAWTLGLAILAIAAGIGWQISRRRGFLTRARPVAIWLLGTLLGAVVLLSDGADNSGGVDRETIAQIRQRQIPIHTVGFGKEKLNKDIEISDVVLPARTLADARLAAEVTFRNSGYAGQKAKLMVK